MKEILLSQGKVAIVDDEDYIALSAYKWYALRSSRAKNTYYARRNVSLPGGKQTSVMMHQVITGTKNPDHRDGDGLNNQRHNLRKSNRQQNGANKRKLAKAASKFKGVSRVTGCSTWQVHVQGKYRGTRPTEIAAAVLYNAVALELFGEFALLNKL